MNVTLQVLAILVLAFVSVRLAGLSQPHPSARCRLTWNLWVLGQVGIAVGALSVLCSSHQHAVMFTMAGLALQYGVRIKRRSTDR